MKAHKALRVQFLLFILIAGTYIPALQIPPVLADPTTGQTTLYFTDALTYLESENYSDLGFITMSQTPPTKQNDSEYPPNLFVKNTTRLFPRYQLNFDQWLTWFSTSWLLYLLQDTPEFNLSELFPGFELFLPHPFRVVEGYSTNRSESVTIQGDIVYNLYFSSDIKLKKFRDKVKVELYSMNFESMLPLPKRIENITVDLIPKRFNDIYKQQIIIPDVSYTLAPGDSLLFSVEIIPSNKTISTFITKRFDIDKILTRAEKFANFLENRSRLNKLQTFGTSLKEIISIFEDNLLNITSEDIASIVNAMRSSSFIYDSVHHPSSVSIPARISEDDIRIYYLHPEQQLSETQQEGTNTSKAEKIEIQKTPIIWATNQGLERNKILKVQDVTAELYFSRILCIIPRKVSVTVTLYDDNTTITSAEKQLTRNELQGFLHKKITPIIFNFSGMDREISYGHKFKVGISLSNGTRTVRTPLYLNYNSIEYPSRITVKFEETQNIQIQDLTATPVDGKIIPGGSVQFLFNVTSLKTDTLQISTIQKEKIGAWTISTPTSVSISANSFVSIPVFVNSTNQLKEAYGNIINLIIVVTGRTGIARYEISAEVSEEAIEYTVEILGYANSINISKGENRFFYFIIKNNNTGATDDVDSYTITAASKNDWPLIPQKTIKNLGIGKRTDADDARVLIQVPKNTSITSDVITITVTSDSSSDASATITITVNVIGGDFIEEILNFFDAAARSLGLNDIFGSDAKFVLLLILVVIILFFLIILAFVFTTKPVRIICTNRIEEIDPTEKAVFEVTLKNPFKKTQSYEIEAQQTAPSSKWVITLEPATIVIQGRSSKTIQVIVTPTDVAKSKEWTQVTIAVKKTGKKNKETLALMTMMKEGKTLLQIHNVSHWPATFNPGEKVITSFSLSNKGSVSARNAKVFFYLNGRQKNKVDVTLPVGNIADIQIPWIAEKGKNQVRIRVKE